MSYFVVENRKYLFVLKKLQFLFAGSKLLYSHFSTYFQGIHATFLCIVTTKKEIILNFSVRMSKLLLFFFGC